MKHLLIKVDDNVMFEGEVTEFQWTETSSAVTAKGVLRRQAGGGSGKAILDALAAAAKQRPAEPVPAQPAEPVEEPDVE